MSSVVALGLITSSMRLVGAIASGETPTADEANDALDVLNDILEAWATENLMLYRNENDQYSLTPNKQSYTIGPIGDFNAVRPVTIEGAFVTYNGLDFPLRVLNTEQWNGIALKNFSAPIPSALYYVPTFPLGNIYLWPAPSQAIPLTLAVNMQFSQLANVSQSISLPPGYKKALRYVLAVELAPEFGVEAPPSVVVVARDMIGNIKAANRQQPVASFDNALTGNGGTGLAGFLAGF